jgi:uracil-DNA glycosylase family 4
MSCSDNGDVTDRGQSGPDSEILRLLGEVACCRRCAGLRPWRKFTLSSHGNLAAQTIIVGEAPGEKSLDRGGPWRGQAGRRLRNILAKVDAELEQVAYLTDAVKCGPPGNRHPSKAECTACAPFLHHELDLLRPKWIVTLGGEAFSLLAGSIFEEESRAVWGARIPQITDIHNAEGYCRLSAGGTTLIPLLHPARANMYMAYSVYQSHLEEVFVRARSDSRN